MSEQSKRKRDAIPPDERAGYKLDRDISYPVLMRAPSGQSAAHGWIDPHSHIYQCGGELREILFIPTMMLSVPMPVWETMKRAGVRTWEAIDHDSNTSYRIGVAYAEERGRKYSTKNGERWGVHIRYCEHVDAQGREVRSGHPAPASETESASLQGRMDL